MYKMSDYAVNYRHLFKLIPYKDVSWGTKLQALCLTKGISDSSTTWWWELFPGSTFRIKMCHKRCFWGLLWPSSVLRDSAFGWWNEESDIPLVRQRFCDFVSHDTSVYWINLNKCRSIHYISLMLYTWSIYVYAYIYRYIHAYIIFVNSLK